MTHGQLTVTVWPAYIGLGPEPFDDPNYLRGQIMWRQQGSDIVGAAQCHAPKGVYRQLLFFNGPQQHALIGTQQLEYPIVFDRPGVIDIDPIRNQDYLPRGAA
jgi:hypothetical protein